MIPKNEEDCILRYNFRRADWLYYHRILSEKVMTYSENYLESLDVNLLNSMITKDIKDEIQKRGNENFSRIYFSFNKRKENTKKSSQKGKYVRK